EQRAEAIAGREHRRSLIVHKERDRLIGQSRQIEPLPLGVIERASAARKVHVVVIRRCRRGENRQARERLPDPAETHCAPPFAASAAAMRVRISLSRMLTATSLTGRAVAGSSISSRLAARCALGSLPTSEGSANSPCVSPVIHVIPCLLVHRK